jgi:hypothetical protein
VRAPANSPRKARSSCKQAGSGTAVNGLSRRSLDTGIGMPRSSRRICSRIQPPTPPPRSASAAPTRARHHALRVVPYAETDSRMAEDLRHYCASHARSPRRPRATSCCCTAPRATCAASTWSTGASPWSNPTKARAYPAPAEPGSAPSAASARRSSGTGLDLGKSSVSDTCLTRSTQRADIRRSAPGLECAGERPLTLDRHAGGVEQRHYGRIAVDARNRRWCSDPAYRAVSKSSCLHNTCPSCERRFNQSKPLCRGTSRFCLPAPCYTPRRLQRAPGDVAIMEVVEGPVSRDNLDENGSDNQSLKWRPVAKS